MITNIKKRFEYIDYVKGIGILCIMLAHVIQNFPVMNVVNTVVRSFHVPVFFMAAGMLRSYSDEKFDRYRTDRAEYVLKRAKQLLVPYVVFSIFNSVVKFSVLALKGNIGGDVVREELRQLFITGNGTVWFLLTLFLVDCIFYFGSPPFLFRGFYEMIYVVAWMCMMLIVPFIWHLDSDLGTLFLRFVMGAGFYYAGYILCQLMKEYIMLNKWTGVTYIVIGLLAALFLRTDIDFFNGRFNYPVGSLVAALCISIGIINICFNLEAKDGTNAIKQVLSYFGKNSLIVMLVHPTILLCVTYPLGARLSQISGVAGVIASVLIFAGLCVLQIPFVFLINKYVPFLIGKQKQ